MFHIGLVIFTGVICWVLHCLLRKNPYSAIPAPHMYTLFLQLIISKFDLVGTYQLLNKKYGDIFRTIRFTTVRSPEYLEVLFSNPNLQLRTKLDGLFILTGEPNLLSVGPERSRIIKKFYSRYFVNASHIDSLKISGDAMIQRLRKDVGKRWISAADFIKEAVITSVVRSAFDIEINDYPELLPVILDLEKYQMLAVLRAVSPFHRNDFLFYNFLGGKDLTSACQVMTETWGSVVGEKKKALEVHDRAGRDVSNTFIYGILREKETDDVINVKSELMTLQITAFDTTKVTTSFALIMLGIHPEIQEKVYEEDRKIQMELDGREMTDKDLTKYEYLQRVIKETLRMYPPVPVIIRKATSDVQMGKYTIPKGAQIMGSIITVQRDPDIFPDPSKFDPDRFLPSNTKNRHKYAYSPFSAGVRACPGSRYGILSATYLLATIVRNFKVSTKYQNIEELDGNLQTILTLHDKGNYPICVESRH